MDSKLLKGALAAVTALVLGGCGLEGLFNQYGGNQYTQPVSTIRGKVPWEDAKFTVIDVNGNETAPYYAWSTGGVYEVELIADSYSNLRLRAAKGQAVVEAFVPKLGTEETLDGIDLDTTSTAAVKIVEGLLGPSGKELTNLSDDLLCIMGKKVAAKTDVAPTSNLIALMNTINSKAKLDVNTTTYTFQQPEVAADYTVTKSALNPTWLARTFVDYTGDGVIDSGTGPFDVIFVDALKTVELSAPPNPDLLRVVFQVNFNAGQLNGNCGEINRFKWTRDEPGRQMYFVGGIHKDSPEQSTEIDAMLGNRGGWTPNQVRMYDDGTHGDKVAADNIWTITFDLPRNVRLGYKYTWGKQGMLWTGTEEWPGNQRLLEVVDENADGYIYRADNFGDEATNKDLYNLNPASGGSLDWNEDLNGDGYPEAGETPIDTDGVCGPDEFVTPDWVPALTISCDDYVAE